MTAGTAPLLTVVIPTYNGERYLEALLEAVCGQVLDGELEILVIDSGSTDKTLEILRLYPEARVHRIPNAEFGHGRTRNLGAQLARGEFIAFLSHDAIPIGNRWAQSILAPFAISPQVVAVVGKQVPRPGCFPLLKYQIFGVFAAMGPDFSTALSSLGDVDPEDAVVGAMGFYSDVNSATRREFLLTTLPYRDVPYAEDQLFGRDLVRAGYTKAYAPLAAVEHSNDLTLAEYRLRIFDETVGLRRIGEVIPVLTPSARFRLSLRGMIGDTVRILRDPAYSGLRKIFWLLRNPRYQWVKWAAYQRATLVDPGDPIAVAALSLEHSRKR